MAANATQRLHALQEWLDSNNIWYDKEVLRLVDEPGTGIRVVGSGKGAEMDSFLVKIPKDAVLSIQNCLIADVLEQAQMGGEIALAVALMHEISLGADSPWFGYLQSLPHFEETLLFWPKEEETSLLAGTEVEDAGEQDRELLKEDYDTLVAPLLEKHPETFKKAADFSFDRFLNAISLITSRAFEVDAYHGDAMVPLADAFNHLSAGQGGEHVHIETDREVCEDCGARYGYCGHMDLDEEDEDPDGGDGDGDGEWDDVESGEDAEGDDMDAVSSNASSPAAVTTVPTKAKPRDDILTLPDSSDDPMCGLDAEEYEVVDDDAKEGEIMQMTVVRRIPPEVGVEVFNTYGERSNASLLHKYGFVDAQPGTNPHDCVTVDLQTVVTTALSLSLLPAANPTSTKSKKPKRPQPQLSAGERVVSRASVWKHYEELFAASAEEDDEEGEELTEEEILERMEQARKEERRAGRKAQGPGRGGGGGHRHAHDHAHDCGSEGHSHDHHHSHGHRHDHNGVPCDGHGADGADEDDEEEEEEDVFQFTPGGTVDARLLALLHIIACPESIFSALADDDGMESVLEFSEAVGAAEKEWEEARNSGSGSAAAAGGKVAVGAAAGGKAKGKGKTAPKIIWVSQDAVARVHSVVVALAKARMERYPTGLEEDEKEWSAVSSRPTFDYASDAHLRRLRMALVVRVSEKRILRDVVERYEPKVAVVAVKRQSPVKGNRDGSGGSPKKSKK